MFKGGSWAVEHTCSTGVFGRNGTEGAAHTEL